MSALLFLMYIACFSFFFFFFNDTATTEIYTLSLHDALPISFRLPGRSTPFIEVIRFAAANHLCVNLDYIDEQGRAGDRKSTRLNSSHLVISYAVFCLKKKNKQI